MSTAKNQSASSVKSSKTGSNKTQVTPQSTLGELGQSLLKFLKPVRSVKAHTVVHDYLENAVKDKSFQAANIVGHSAGSNKESIVGTTQNSVSDHEKSEFKTIGHLGSADHMPAPGQEGSGYINVKREPRTIWLEMVTNLMKDCSTKAINTRSTLGNLTYRDANNNNSDLRRKTVGRIINVITEDRPTVEELLSANSNQPNSPKSNEEHGRKLLSSQYEIDGKPKKKAAA